MARMVGTRNIYRILWGSLLKSCHLKDSRMKWWGKIKMGVNTVICAGMN